MNRAASLACVVCVAVLSNCGSTPPEGTARIEVDLPDQVHNLSGDRIGSATVVQDGEMAVQLTRAEGPIAMHRHRASEETFYLVSGEGMLKLADGDRALHAGDLVVLPRNTPHGFTPTGPNPAILLSFFVPPFKTGDAILEETLQKKR